LEISTIYSSNAFAFVLFVRFFCANYYLDQRGPNIGTRAACGPQTLSACHILHKVINTLY